MTLSSRLARLARPVGLPAGVFAALVIASLTTDAAGAVTEAVKCESGQLKAVASYASCRLKADAIALTKNISPDFTKCSEKITSKFPALEDANACNSEGDVAQIISLSDNYEQTVAFILSGSTTTTSTTTTTLGPTGACGDGAIDAGEDCDIGALGGATCASEGFFNGTLLCDPGCTFNTSQCNPARFEVKTNTVVDHQTNLEWEKKTNLDNVVNLANVHDADNTYTWAASGNVQSGTLYTSFLMTLNGTTDLSPPGPTTGCFDNHCDWRIPNIVELRSIAVRTPGCGATSCLVDPALAPQRNTHHWSNTTRAGAPSGGYFVDFNSGAAASDLKTNAKYARAVRSVR